MSAAAMLTFPPRSRACYESLMSGQSPSLTQRLAERLARPVSDGHLRRAALHVLDWTGCAVAGAGGPAGRAVASGLGGEGKGPCTAIGSDRRVSVLTAAMINGALGNVLEMDDVDKRAILHPGPSVIPAALAAAQAVDAPAEAFLAAVVRGYEAVIALGRAVGPGHYAFWHNTGTCGPFGAAAAAASLYGLGPEQSVHALGLAGTQASGFWQTRHEPQSMAKQLHTARAAHAGVSAVLFARSGMLGPVDILEGPQGFFAATCPGADPDQVMADQGAEWLIEQVSFKPWPACRHAHPAIDAALAARAAGMAASDIHAIVLTTYPDAVAFCDTPRPQSVIEAKFSLQHSIAAALLFGPLELAHFEPGFFQRRQVRALAGKVVVAAADPYTARYPAHYGAGLAVTLASGETRRFDAPDALGDPENPLGADAVAKKARALMAAGGMAPDASAALESAALGLADGGALGAYAEALMDQRRGGA